MSQIPNTLIIGKVLYQLDQCESTNLYAKECLAKSKPPDGSVVITDNQTKGRGQYGNNWESTANENIHLSIILYPKINVKEQFYLSKITSLACVKALNSITNLDFEIKWPNDIYYKKQKVGGILIENQIMGDKIANAIVGIGINLNQESFENLPQATSIYKLVRYLLSRKKCTEILLQAFDAEYLKLQQSNFLKINKEYFEYLKSYQEEFNYLENGEMRSGFLKEVNTQGQLVVLENGIEKYINFKEIEWVL